LLGVEADSLVYQTYYITNDFTYNFARLFRAVRWFGPLRHLVRALLRLGVFAWACVRYDRFHFYADRGLLDSKDFIFNYRKLKPLHVLGKEISSSASGADVRLRQAPQALGDPNCSPTCPAVAKHCICDDPRGLAHQAKPARYATAII